MPLHRLHRDPISLIAKPYFKGFRLICVGLVAFLPSAAWSQIDTTWNGGAGAWNTAANWSGNAVPNNNGANFFNVFVDAGNGVVSTVTLPTNQSFTIDSLTISAGDSVVVSNNDDFIVTQDIGRVNSGRIVNGGTLSLLSTGSATDLRIERNITLSGGGVLSISGANARILDEANTGLGFLTNVNNTIQGEGSIGANTLSFTNQAGGLIVANVAGGRLTLDPRNGTVSTNLGTMRASGAGILHLTGSGGGGFANAGGTVEALHDSFVELAGGVAISGGTLQTAGTGEIVIPAGTSASFSNGVNSGTMRVRNNSDLYLGGTIQNNGSIFVDSAGSATDLRIEQGDVTLTGNGTVNLLGTNARILDEANTGSGRLLNQGNTIQGRGNIGANTMRISNSATSLIHANVNGSALVLDPRNATTVQNDGTLRASSGGILHLTGSGGGTFTNTIGTIEALDGSTVELAGNANVSGGVLRTFGTGEFVVGPNNSATISDLNTQGLFRVRNNSDLFVGGTIQNAGSIILDSTVSATDMRVDGGTVQLTGGGTVTLSGANARILDEANTGLGFLQNQGNTIQGIGNIGSNTMGLSNASGRLIHANVSGGTLVLDPRNGTNVQNDGTLRASSGGTLHLTGNGGGGFANGASGIIEALPTSFVELAGGAVVQGGLLRTTGDGEIGVGPNNTGSIANLTNQGTFRVRNNTDLFLGGTIQNTGSIIVDSMVSATDLRVEGGTVQLTGGGTITLSGANARILDEANTGLGFLQNQGNTLQGRGNIGGNTMRLSNAAGSLIHANVSGELLALDPRNGTNVQNLGTLRASGGGVLHLTGFGGGGFDNTGGVTEALTGSFVELAGGANVFGGILRTTGTGEFAVNANSNAAISNLNNQGMLRIRNNSDLFAGGTIQNAGSIVLDSTGNATDMRVEGAEVILSGSGTVILQGSNARILDEANSGLGHLRNQGNTLQGAGNIGGNTMQFTNAAGSLVHANVLSALLALDPRNGTDAVNEGIMRASGGGALHLTGNGGGGFVNRNGGRYVVESRLEIAGTALRNQAGGRVEGTGTIATLNGGLLLNEAGVVAPGLSFGILTVSGNFQQAVNGRLEIELGGHTPGTNQDQLLVSGQANLAGILDVNPSVAIADPGTRGTIEEFTVMTFGSRVAGFTTIDYDGTLLNPDFQLGMGGVVAYDGVSGTSGLDGMFRRIKYTASEVLYSNYLALPGDANGDAVVDGSDFGIWNANKFTTGTTWITGDFNGDGLTDGSDFGIWNANKFTSADVANRGMVPEPSGTIVVLGACIALTLRRQRFGQR